MRGRAAILIFVFLLIFSTPAIALIANGSFENGTIGWQSTSGIEIYENLGNGLITATDGSHFLYTEDSSDNFFSNSFTIEPGVKNISFDFNVITNLNVPSTWVVDGYSRIFLSNIYLNDYTDPNFQRLHINVCDTSTTANYINYRDETLEMNNWVYPLYDIGLGTYYYNNSAFSALSTTITSDSGAVFDKQTGWHHVVVDVSELAGLDYEIQLYGYTSINPHIGTGSTAMLLDNVKANYTPVPAPATMLLLGLGLIGLAVSRKRLQK